MVIRRKLKSLFLMHFFCKSNNTFNKKEKENWKKMLTSNMQISRQSIHVYTVHTPYSHSSYLIYMNTSSCVIVHAWVSVTMCICVSAFRISVYMCTPIYTYVRVCACRVCMCCSHINNNISAYDMQTDQNVAIFRCNHIFFFFFL